jgi:hypothetical protein
MSVIVACAVFQLFSYALVKHTQLFERERLGFMPMRGFQKVATLVLLGERIFLLGFAIVFWTHFGIVDLLVLTASSFLLSLIFQLIVLRPQTFQLVSLSSFVAMPVSAWAMVAAAQGMAAN